MGPPITTLYTVLDSNQAPETTKASKRTVLGLKSVRVTDLGEEKTQDPTTGPPQRIHHQTACGSFLDVGCQHNAALPYCLLIGSRCVSNKIVILCVFVSDLFQLASLFDTYATDKSTLGTQCFCGTLFY